MDYVRRPYGSGHGMAHGVVELVVDVSRVGVQRVMGRCSERLVRVAWRLCAGAGDGDRFAVPDGTNHSPSHDD